MRTDQSHPPPTIVLGGEHHENGQIHSSNSSTTAADNCLSVLDHFVGLVLKGLKYQKKETDEQILDKIKLIEDATSCLFQLRLTNLDSKHIFEKLSIKPYLRKTLNNLHCIIFYVA